MFIEIVLPGRKNEIIGVIYRPNTQPWADVDVFHVTLNDILGMVNNERKLCTVMGDFNIDLLQYNTNHKTNLFLDDIFSLGFVPVILKPTRITDTTATLIDHIYTNNISELKQSAIVITDVADHLATSVFFEKQSKVKKSKTIKSRDFSESNISKFKNYLLQADYADVYMSLCPDESYSAFINIYQTGFDESFPLCEKKVEAKKQTEPWYTAELKTSRKIKNKLYKNKLKNPTTTNTDKYKEELKRYNSLRRNLKQNYYKNKLLEYKTNIKKTWSFINNTIGKTKQKPKYPTHFTINNATETDKNKIANSFNNFFY